MKMIKCKQIMKTVDFSHKFSNEKNEMFPRNVLYINNNE